MAIFPPGAGPGRIGLDCDNTLIDYDRLFWRLAVEAGLLGREVAPAKAAVRRAVRALPDGEAAWRRLQATAYGERIGQAALFPGVADFLRLARARGCLVCLVSHKPDRPAAGGADMRRAALGFLEAAGLFSPKGSGLDPNLVFFEDTRAAKLARIDALALDVFVDDLPEVLAEPDFPAGATRVLFAPAGPPAGGAPAGTVAVDSFAALGRLVFGGDGARP